MEPRIESCLSQLQYRNSHMYGRMEVVPLFSGQDPGPGYFTLDRALSDNLIVITEVSKGGDVPRVRVMNRGTIPVLLIDGEEISGAKQNRVLNTSILVPGESELEIPVSCTECGRWNYASSTFQDSRVMMDSTIRSKKMASVGRAMKHRSCREADQGEIWKEISEMSDWADVHSPTGAMKDVFESQVGKMTGYLDAFPLQPGQCGVLVYMDGKPAGMELLSRPEAYAHIHEKLIRSYVLEALLGDEEEPLPCMDIERPKEFFFRVASCTGDSYPAVGLGTEHRIEGNDLVGSALSHEQRIVHMACFQDKPGWISRARTRQRSRGGAKDGRDSHE